MKIEHSTTANCTPEQAWATFTNIENWTRWSPLLAAASWPAGEPWVAGSTLQLDIAQPKFKFKVVPELVEPPNHVRLKAGAMGIDVAHDFRFTAQPAGGTLIHTVAELSGPAAFFLNEKTKQQVLTIFQQVLEKLKAQAESSTR